MSRPLLCSLLLCSSLCPCLHAFAAPLAPVTSTRAAQVAQLQSWADARKIDTPSPLNLDVRAADLEAARATKPLQAWVRRGGIVVLHTDAAGVFGFQTVQARERTFDRAGQLWGKSENALPFGGSPLFLGGRSQSRLGQTDGVPGVRTVFYQLDSGDALLQASGPAVVPLLRVQDNTAPTKNTAEPVLYAAAMRRYGAGWALFVPRTIEARADGALFQKNLEGFIAAANENKWLSLPVSALGSAYAAASQKRKVDWQSLRGTLRPALDEQQLPLVSDEAQLVLSLDDAKAVDAVTAQADAAPTDDQERGRALVYLLAARALWQKDNDDGAPAADAKLAALWDASSTARQALWQSQSDGPAAAMTRWWCGVFALGAALPPVPTRYEPTLIAFSYAQPALEAGKWWQDVNTADEALKSVVAVAAQAAMQMAQQHKDDPPLLSYWKTDSGTRYWMQLAPIQAASNQFPPLPQEWGMPMREVSNKYTNLSNLLVPVEHANAMPMGAVPQPLVYPDSNKIIAEMFWRCSRFWSDAIPHRWGLSQAKSRILLSPLLPSVWVSPLGDKVEKVDGTYSSFAQGNKIYFRFQVHYPNPSWSAFIHQFRILLPNQKPQTKQDYADEYDFISFGEWPAQEFSASPTPARVTRLQAHLQLTFWVEDATTPQWIDDGLQNNFSLDMSDVIRLNQNDLRAITAFPPNQKVLIRVPRTALAGKMLSYALRQSLVSTDPEVEPVLTAQNDGFGASLAKLDSTHRVSYFYQKYGAGAFVETLQRLGSGQNIDEALQATTGLTQAQFLAAADAS